MRERINDDDEGNREMRQCCLDWGLTRKNLKNPAMTYFYGRTKRGMTKELREEEELGYHAAKYLTEQVFAAIEEIAAGPAKVMSFLRSLAIAAGHQEKVLQWVSPVGLPWSNRYHNDRSMPVTLLLQGKEMRLHLAVEDETEEVSIDKDRAANGAAPNFVHACDAAHLMLTVNAAVAEGIASIATVHDSSAACLRERNASGM